MKTVSVIIPCYNEKDTVIEFYNRLKKVADSLGEYTFAMVFVNDGSTDGTDLHLDVLARADTAVKVVTLAKNAGHQIAITAGMDVADGDFNIIIDADLQDPPEVIPEMLAKLEEGFDLVHAQRKVRRGESWFKLCTAKLFYKSMRKFATPDIVEDSGDFRAFNRDVLYAVRQFRERHRFMRGIFTLVGFRSCIIQYERDRRYAGETKYPLRKMVSLATNAIFSFSSSPIRFIIWMSLLFWGLSLTYLVKSLIEHFVYRITVPGWTSLVILITFYNGLILFCIGIIGAYVGKIFEQSQNRPLYLIRSTKNLDTHQVEENPDDLHR